MLTGEEVPIERHREPERESEGPQKRKGFEKKQVEREGYFMNQVDFQQRFVFFLLFCVAHLSSLKFFSALVRQQKHHISVIFI